ncbi:MAG: DEAD/DEAH box helicase family protein [bacterium]|nr:DEAD/DEAH box helicase family protein [bacterium]
MRYALRERGLFLDTGLGKTVCQLEWARQCAEHSNGRALILTPLAVTRQIEREGLRFGYQIRV